MKMQFSIEIEIENNECVRNWVEDEKWRYVIHNELVRVIDARLKNYKVEFLVEHKDGARLWVPPSELSSETLASRIKRLLCVKGGKK